MMWSQIRDEGDEPWAARGAPVMHPSCHHPSLLLPRRDLLAELNQRVRRAVALPVRIAVKDIYDETCTELLISAPLDSGASPRVRPLDAVAHLHCACSPVLRATEDRNRVQVHDGGFVQLIRAHSLGTGMSLRGCVQVAGAGRG